MQLKLVVWFICSVFFWKDKGRFLQRLPVVLHMNVLHQMQNMSYWKYDVVRIVHHKVSAHHHSFYDKAIISFTVIWCFSPERESYFRSKGGMGEMALFEN